VDFDLELKRIQALLVGKNLNQIAKDCGLAQATVRRIFFSESSPSIKTMDVLAKYIKRKHEANEPLPEQAGSSKKYGMKKKDQKRNVKE
jgi:transcriptional regulator with XRE-family HTH domain